jgi:hypothetical protein
MYLNINWSLNPNLKSGRKSDQNLSLKSTKLITFKWAVLVQQFLFY